MFFKSIDYVSFAIWTFPLVFTTLFFKYIYYVNEFYNVNLPIGVYNIIFKYIYYVNEFYNFNLPIGV